MTMPLFPLLGLNAGEIVSLLIAIGVILSGIFGQVNETKKTQQKRKSTSRRESGDDGSVAQLEAIAQRRRQQLEALARKRRGGGTVENESLSVTQASERQSARAASDERAAVIRAQETSDAVRWSDPGDRVTENTALDARIGARKALRQRGDAQREAQQEARRVRMQEKAERQAQQQRQLQAQRQKQRQQGQRASQPPRIVRGVEPVTRRVQQSAEDREAESVIQMALDQVYAVEAIDQPEGSTPRRPPMTKLLALTGGRSWREAIILKEVLDRPVAMRQEDSRI